MAKMIVALLLVLVAVVSALPSDYQEYVRIARSPYGEYNYNPYNTAYYPYNQNQQYLQRYPQVPYYQPSYNRQPFSASNAAAQASSNTGGFFGGAQAQASAQANAGSGLF